MLTLLTVELEQLNRDDETTPTQHDILTVMRKQLRSLSSDLHGLSHQLHPSKLKHLGLVSAMRAMCREIERTGLIVRFSDHEVPRHLPDDVSLTLYRVMQEGLQNISKHSGVSSADAELTKTSKSLNFRLQDQGKGFDLQNIKSGEGLGLSSMRERLNAVKGTFVINSSPGHGTLLEASVPLPEEECFT
jgi:signal transduction histidine kinase